MDRNRFIIPALVDQRLANHREPVRERLEHRTAVSPRASRLGCASARGPHRLSSSILLNPYPQIAMWRWWFSDGDSRRSSGQPPAGSPRGPSPTQCPSGGSSSPPRKSSGEFDDEIKDACWEKAKKILGRDPDRWREDVVGNMLCRGLHRAPGVLGFEYDHIIPYSEIAEGLNTLDNCQILQSAVKKAKENDKNLSLDQMRDVSLKHDFDDHTLDAMEIFLFGDVKRPDREHFADAYEGITGDKLPGFGRQWENTK